MVSARREASPALPPFTLLLGTGLPLGDGEWTELLDGRQVETCCRLYSGPGNTAVLVFAREGMCEVVFVSDHGEGRWTVTGLAHDSQRLVGLARARGAENAGLVIDSRDEPIAEIAAAPSSSTSSRPRSAPRPRRSTRLQCPGFRVPGSLRSPVAGGAACSNLHFW